jgi:hypothetical protein
VTVGGRLGGVGELQLGCMSEERMRRLGRWIAWRR